MNNFDWVQWYYFALVAFYLIACYYLDGKKKSESQHNFKDVVWWALLYLPVTGRIFLWW